MAVWTCACVCVCVCALVSVCRTHDRAFEQSPEGHEGGRRAGHQGKALQADGPA